MTIATITQDLIEESVRADCKFCVVANLVLMHMKPDFRVKIVGVIGSYAAEIYRTDDPFWVLHTVFLTQRLNQCVRDFDRKPKSAFRDEYLDQRFQLPVELKPYLK